MLRKMYLTAIADRNLQGEAHRGFTQGLPAGLVEEWEALCVDWEQASFPKSKNAAVNPYEMHELCKFAVLRSLGVYSIGVDLSEKQVHEELNREESKRVTLGGVVLHKTSSVQYIVLGLEIEDSQ